MIKTIKNIIYETRKQTFTTWPHIGDNNLRPAPRTVGDIGARRTCSCRHGNNIRNPRKG